MVERAGRPTCLHQPAKPQPRHLPLPPQLKNFPGPQEGRAPSPQRILSKDLPRTYLFHEHVNVGLRSVQHVAVGVPQPLDRDVHGFAIYVDPPPRSRGQEQPGAGREVLARAAEPGWILNSEQLPERQGLA